MWQFIVGMLLLLGSLARLSSEAPYFSSAGTAESTGYNLGGSLIPIIGLWLLAIGIQKTRSQVKDHSNADSYKKSQYWTFWSIAIGIIFILIVALSSYIENQTASWVKFNSTEGKFSIDFPSYPKTEKKNQPVEDSNTVLEQTNYQSSSKNVFYNATFITYPSEVSSQSLRDELKKNLDAITLRKDFELISSNQTFLDSNYAVDFHIRNRIENVYIKGRAILVGQTFYMLMNGSTMKNEGYNDADYIKFINSFKVTRN